MARLEIANCLRHVLPVAACVLLMPVGASGAPKSQPAAPDAAHAIAEKFAKEAAAAEEQRQKAAKEAAARAARKRREEERKRLAEQRKAEEVEMLARARAEAEQRWLAAAEAERKREEERELERQRLAEQRAKDEQERRRTAEIAARAEAEKTAALERQRMAEEEARRKAERDRKAEIAEAARQRALAEETERKQRAERDRRMAEVEAEARRIAEDEAREAAAFATAQRLHDEARQRQREIARSQSSAQHEPSPSQSRLATVDPDSRETDADDPRTLRPELRRALERRLERAARDLADQLEQDPGANRPRLAFEREQPRSGDAPSWTDNDPARSDDQQRLFGESERDRLATRALREGLASGPHSQDSARSRDDERVAVLLVMEPSAARKWHRRHRRTDPILCSSDGCYISQGASEPAQLLSRRQALGLGNALGRRAGDCRGDDTCVFRAVDLARGGYELQPVNMRVLRHERRARHVAQPDWSCRVERRALTCGAPIVEADYRMWLVPEAVAAEAGPALLEDALSRGLVNPFSASARRLRSE